MAALAPITILDGKATPESHVFVPVGVPVGSDFNLFVNRGADGKPELQEELRAKISVNGGQSPYRTKISLILPVAKTVDSVTTIDFQNRVDVEFIMNKKSTSASRADLLAMIESALGSTELASMIVDLEQLY